jgi:23S rRNA pseudouridine2605 synthase
VARRSKGRRRPKDRPARRGRPAEARGERLQKVIAAAGVASRRAAEELIRAGRVRVNGTVVRELGSRADARRDRIEVDGERIGRPERPRSYVVYKPRGVVSTTRDPHAKRTVLELVPDEARLFPVGRLDARSEGLLVLTNDGALAQRLAHPSHEVPRTYRVSVAGVVRAPVLRRLVRGVELEGRPARFDSARLIERDEAHSVLEVILREGRKRQIREMLKAVGHPVRRLVRVRFGPLELGDLRPGEWRPLRAEERRALERLTRGPSPTEGRRRS